MRHGYKLQTSLCIIYLPHGNLWTTKGDGDVELVIILQRKVIHVAIWKVVNFIQRGLEDILGVWCFPSTNLQV
mgnify:CR=1